MSAQAASGAERRPQREWWPWLGHNAWKIFLVSMVLSVVRSVWEVSHESPWWLAPVWTAALITLFFAWHAHDRQICERCIAKWPLGPEVALRKNMWALRWTHMIMRTKRRAYIYCAVLAVAIIAIGLVLPKWAYPFAIAAVFGWVGTTTYSTQMHTRLQPWCPWCKDNGGGEQFSPDPVPDPSVKADR